MKIQIRFIFSLLLTFQLAFAPLASAQSDGVIENLEHATDLDDKTAALRAYLLQEYKAVENISDFVDIFADERPEAEKEEIQKMLSNLTELPEVEPIESGIKISVGTLVFKIDLRNVKKKQFIINGVHFTLDPSLSITTQADLLLKKLQVQGGNKGLYGKIFSMFVREAHAVIPLAPIAMIFVTTFATKAAEKYSVKVLNAIDKAAADNNNKKKTAKKAPAKKAKAKPVAKKSKAPKKVAKKPTKKAPTKVATAKEEAAEVEEAVEVKTTIQMSNEKCPKDLNAYNADLKVSEDSKQSVVKIQGNYKNGKFREVNVYEDVPSPTSPTGIERKIIATYVLNANSRLEEILLPGEEKSETDGAMVPTLLRIKDDGEETDESNLEALSYHKNILSYVTTRATACKKAAVSPTKSVGSPKTGISGAQ